MRSIFQLVLGDAIPAVKTDLANLLVAAMPLVHSTPAVAIQRACVPCVANPIRTMAHFGASQWFRARCVASVMLAEALKRTVARNHPQPLAGTSSFVYPKRRTGPRASALCLLCHFHLKICIDSAVTSLVGFISFPLVMAHRWDSKKSLAVGMG